MKSETTIYNHGEKLRYIKYENKNPATLINYFTRIAEKETEYGKDIVEMNMAELKDTINSLKIRREDSRSHLISILRGYASWAKKNSVLKSTEAIFEITPDEFDTKDINLQSMVKSPEHLAEILDGALDFVNYRNKSSQNALYCWLSYIGLKTDDIQILEKDFIDIDRQLITVNNNTYSFDYIDDCPIVKLWERCSSMRYIEKKNSWYDADDKRKKRRDEYIHYQLADNNYILRSAVRSKYSEDSPMPRLALLNITIKMFENSSGNVTKTSASNIRVSGMYYKLYTNEKKGLELTDELFADYFDIKHTESTDLATATRRYRVDYDAWKSAFDYQN
jgi:hypothetical protein